MGKDSRRRRKQQREKRQRALARGAFVRATRVVCQVQQLEIAKGHDGLLRGAPEAALLLGVYEVGPATARMHGRYLYRFEQPGAFPAKVGVRIESHESLVFVPSQGARVAVLALALEEDSGRGLQALYAELEHGDAIVAWLEHGAAAVPTHLPELIAGTALANVAHKVQLMFGDKDPTREADGDDWIGANLLWTTLDAGRRRHRLAFVSADGRNDWTAELELTVGPA